VKERKKDETLTLRARTLSQRNDGEVEGPPGTPSSWYKVRVVLVSSSTGSIKRTSIFQRGDSNVEGPPGTPATWYKKVVWLPSLASLSCALNLFSPNSIVNLFFSTSPA
jgi:hypothetical protein